jgi:glycosyltransferase involved in cell wall biosynthesis
MTASWLPMSLAPSILGSRHAAPKVSVVMPVHNGGAFLSEAIESILVQTLDDFEFVIVDDGSTDETGAILADYQRRDARIRIQSDDRRGTGAALNTALQLARGEYAARMDADDVSLPGRLAMQVAFMDANREVGVCGTWIKTFGASRNRVERYPLDDATLRCGLLFGDPFAHPSVILRRQLFIEAGLLYETNSFVEDYELWTRAEKVCRLANIPRVLLHYRLHGSQISRRHSDEQRAASKSVRLTQLATLNIRPSKEQVEVHEAISNLYTHLGKPLQPSIEFLDRAADWLRFLRLSNQKANAFPEPAFSFTLSRQWYKLCSASVALGWSVWLRARREAFCSWGSERLLHSLKLAAKCALGMRASPQPGAGGTEF